VVILITAGSFALASCGSSTPPERKVSFTGPAYPNVDPANTRQAGGPIDASSVSGLKVAWTLPLAPPHTYGSFFSSSPVVSNGVVYTEDSRSNVRAIDLESGEVLWEKRYGTPFDQEPNGIVVAGGRVYGATPQGMFALDQKTGKELWSATLTRNENERVAMAPGYDAGRVYVSTVPARSYAVFKAGGAGVLWALDAKTGRKLWHFDTVPRSLWGDARLNSGGGLSYAPAFDGKGSMYFGVDSPGPAPGTTAFPWGSSRPGPNLYTDSIVKLNAKSGKMRWHYQLTPHDLYAWDLQGPPILMTLDGRQLVVAAGRAGIAIELDAKSGKLIWKRPLGRHGGHEGDGREAMRSEYSKLKAEIDLHFYPGYQGGVAAPMSSSGTSVFASVVNHPMEINAGSEIREFSQYYESELVALNAKTGAIEWKREFPSRYAPALGATTSVNDLVFATTLDGQVLAFDAKDGKVAWQSKLPAGTDTGVSVAGDTVIAPAGMATQAGDKPEIVAYRLGG
jgi:outer membrane protein assembly factor BamB